MATAAEIQTAYKAIYRADLNATVATAIANTGISLDAYIAQQLPQVASTTQAAVAIASFVTGTAPTSDKLDALKVEADKQVASYTALGVGNPSLGAYEAFGRSFATDTTTTAGFNTKYGALSTTDFVTLVYAQVYGTTPSAGALANLTGQINYFTNLYTTNGVANAALAAKGAVLGQIVGYAFVSSASANSILDNQVQSLLTSAAKGDATVYNKALPTAVDPGQAGVTITLIAGTEGVSMSAADPAFKTTNFNDIINAPVFTTATIDGAGGEDVLNVTVAANTAIATGQLINVETVNLNKTGAFSFDVDKATGIKAVAITNATADGASFTNLAAGVTLSVVDTDTAAATSKSAVFTFKDVTGTADVANLTVNGLDTVGKSVSVAGVETLNVSAVTANSAFTLIDNELKALNVSAAKNIEIAGGATFTALETVVATGAGSVTLTGNLANTIKSIDASGLTGTTGITFTAAAGANALTSVKGGAGADNIEILGTTKAVVIDSGAGNDVIKYTSSNTTAGAALGEVLSGAGNDTVTLTSTGSAAGAAVTQKVTLGAGSDSLTLADTGNVVTTIFYSTATDSTLSFQDSVTGFKAGTLATATAGADIIDIKAFGLASATIATTTAGTPVPVADVANLFTNAAATIVAYNVGGNATLLIDSNKDGNFNLATDFSIKLVGVDSATLTAANFAIA